MHERIAKRYEVEETLGKGGTAIVYQVLDTTTGRRVALKRLVFRGESSKWEEQAKRFEYEFYTLAQLGHPRVIEVYDFGRDETGPFYTMELLDGGDLFELSPIPWKKACSFLFDVCSALCLLHSRRQIHRDLSPRNIRCTRDSKAKLIDFGAMMPMGPCKKVIGIPPLIPPEVFALQWLDARADLYSVGATLYYALTGRHAYPAKSFADLSDIWRSKPRPPSAYVSDIPKELDDLVLALMRIDRMARPVNAAEVMEKLSAIAGLEFHDEQVVRQAFLSMPRLVGREEQVMYVRELLSLAQRGRGKVLLIEGEGGIGRSRFLDACVLEGKLGGAVVLKADAVDSARGNWGVVKALVAELFVALPELAAESARPYARILEQAFPELHSAITEGEALASPLNAAQDRKASYTKEPSGDALSADVSADRRFSKSITPAKIISSIPPDPFGEPQEMRPWVQAALRDWFVQISEQSYLIVVVDDIHRIDEPSAAFLALLAHQASQIGFMLIVTVEDRAPATSVVALNFIKRAAEHIRLHALTLDKTRELLDSVFGEVPNVEVWANRLYSVSRGNPRAIMHLTQFLVDKQFINYQSGAWTLPSAIESSDLPRSINEALRTRLSKLSAQALSLGQTLALNPEQGFSFEECLSLSEHGDTGRLISDLDELIAAEILTRDNHSYTLNHPGWISELTGSLREDRKRTLHTRLANTLKTRDGESLGVIQHILNAGDRERALDLYLEYLEALIGRLERSPQAFSEYFQSLPKNWVETYETLLQVYDEHSRPRKQRILIEYALVALSSVAGSADQTHLTSLIDQLYRDSVLRYYQELGDSLPAPDRLVRALELAQQHYEESPELEKGLDPIETIRYLAQAIITAVALGGVSYDYHLIGSLPSLAPLKAFSEALGIVEKNVQSTLHLTAGRLEQARKGYLEVIERISEPDRGGIEETYYEYTRLTVMYAIGILEASLGMQSALNCLGEFQANPLFQVNGVRLQMVYHLRQGDINKADLCKKRLELLQIQHSPSQFFEGSYVYPEILAYSAADDLNGIKQALDAVQNMASRFSGWKPILSFARAEYQRIRGDYTKALSDLEESLRETKPGQHIIWPYLASVYIRALYEIGRFQEAREAGQKLLVAAQEADLGILCNLITRSLSLVEAKLGAFAEAVETADRTIEQYGNANITGLNLGLAYETRARVAILMGDEPGFAMYAEMCAEQYKRGRNPALFAKYEKLMQDAQRAALQVPEELAHAADLTEIGTATVLTMVATLLSECRGPQERAQRVLEILLEHSHHEAGFLYTIQKEGPVLAAQRGSYEVSADTHDMVVKLLEAELEDTSGVTIQTDLSSSPTEKTAERTVAHRDKYRSVVLGHRVKEGLCITALAVLIRSQDDLFAIPAETVAALSKALLDSGDATFVLAANEANLRG